MASSLLTLLYRALDWAEKRTSASPGEPWPPSLLSPCFLFDPLTFYLSIPAIGLYLLCAVHWHIQGKDGPMVSPRSGTLGFNSLVYWRFSMWPQANHFKKWKVALPSLTGVLGRHKTWRFCGAVMRQKYLILHTHIVSLTHCRAWGSQGMSSS